MLIAFEKRPKHSKGTDIAHISYENYQSSVDEWKEFAAAKNK